MRRLYPLLLAALLPLAILSCADDKAPASPKCETLATIRNFAGLDGCGYLLVLDNGQRLEPHGALWNSYAKHDGERVTISYINAPTPSVCMAGQGVELKCIQQQVGRCGTPPTGSN